MCTLVSQVYPCIPLYNSVYPCIYLLLTEFEVRIVSYGPRAINRREKKRGSVTYSTDREDKVSKILSMRNGFKFLKQVESKTSQLIFEIVFKSFPGFGTQFRVKETFKPLLADRLRKFGDKSRNSLATETT